MRHRENLLFTGIKTPIWHPVVLAQNNSNHLKVQARIVRL